MLYSYQIQVPDDPRSLEHNASQRGAYLSFSPNVTVSPQFSYATLDDLPSGTFILEDSDTDLIRYTLPFRQVQDGICHGGTCTELLNANGALEFTFTGTALWIFGIPGGIARIFVDGELTDVLDTVDIPNDGRALWQMNDLPNIQHTLQVSGVEGENLNLLIDAFGVAGTVTPIVSGSSSTPTFSITISSSTSTSARISTQLQEVNDPNYVPPSPSETRRLTGIIIGSLVAFFVVLIIAGVFVWLSLRQKKKASSTGVKPPLFSFGKKRWSRKPIVVIRKRSIDKEILPGGELPFNLQSTAPRNAYQQAPAANRAVSRFSHPSSPPARPTVAIPAPNEASVPTKTPFQYFQSVIPWSNQAQSTDPASENQESTPLMEAASSRYPTLPWRQERENTGSSSFGSPGYSSHEYSPDPQNSSMPESTHTPGPLSTNSYDNSFAAKLRPGPASATPTRGDSFMSMASSIRSPPPSFKSFEPTATPILDRQLPAVPESVARDGPKYEGFENLRMPEDRYERRNTLEQWNILSGVKVAAQEDPESPLDPGFRRI